MLGKELYDFTYYILTTTDYEKHFHNNILWFTSIDVEDNREYWLNDVYIKWWINNKNKLNGSSKEN